MKAMKEFVQTKKDLFYSLLITIIAGILRFFHLGRKSLWNDELSQLYVSSSSISDFLANISYHPSPPLDYLLLKIPLLFGSSEFLVRLNAAIFGTLTIFVFYHLSRIQFNREIAIISSILLAFSRFHIRFSQEARMYSLFCLLTTLSFYLLWLYIIHKKTKYFYILLAEFLLSRIGYYR